MNNLTNEITIDEKVQKSLNLKRAYQFIVDKS